MPETSVEKAGDSPAIIMQDPHVAAVVQKRDFIDRVIAASGARKSDAKPVIEATLAELGRVLSDGHTLAVPPLGRARISCEKDPRGGDVITLRLRRRPTKTN